MVESDLKARASRPAIGCGWRQPFAVTTPFKRKPETAIELAGSGSATSATPFASYVGAHGAGDLVPVGLGHRLSATRLNDYGATCEGQVALVPHRFVPRRAEARARTPRELGDLRYKVRSSRAGKGGSLVVVEQTATLAQDEAPLPRSPPPGRVADSRSFVVTLKAAGPRRGPPLAPGSPWRFEPPAPIPAT